MKEFGDKVPEEVKSKVEAALTTLKDAITRDSTADMKSGIEALNQEALAMGQAVYSQVRRDLLGFLYIRGKA